MGSLSLLSSFFDRGGRMQHWFARTWARMILKTDSFACTLKASSTSTLPGPPSMRRTTCRPSTFPCSTPGCPRQFRILAKKNCSAIRFSAGI